MCYHRRMAAAHSIINPEPIVKMKDLPPIETDTQTTDDLFLSKYDENNKEDGRVMKDTTLSEPGSSEVAADAGKSQVRLSMQEKRKAILQLEDNIRSQ